MSIAATEMIQNGSGIGLATLAAISLLYLLVLYCVGIFGRRITAQHPLAPWVFSLALSIYCTSWAFYGVTAQAVVNGWWLPPTYIGSFILFWFGFKLMSQIAVACRRYRITSIADFIATRFGHSRRLAVLITLILIMTVIPYITLQLHAVATSINTLVGAVVVASSMSALRKAPAKVEEQRLPLLVNAAVLQPEDLTYRIASQGTVSPKLETTLISEVNGRIVAVSEQFVAGGFFRKGDLLIQVEQADYLTAVKAAEAALAGATAQLEEEKARGRVAESEWRSFTEGKAPALGLRRPQLASALASVQSAEAELDRARRDLARTEIRAPYAGMVRSRNANLGQFISRGSQLGMIYGTELAEVRLPLTDTDFGFLPEGTARELSIPVTLRAVVAGVPQQWQATIVRTEGVLDERSRVIYAVAELADPYQRETAAGVPLQFGRFVQAEITGVAASQMVRVARHLLRPGNQLLVVDEQNNLQFRQVNVARADANFAYISAGFEPSDRLIVSPVTNPLAGTVVRVSGDPVPASEAETAVAANNAAVVEAN